ncbi:hypothetical protein B0J14DRAFT_666358 [Halenospora varia]|nr:hypothetical protein B0J14DRAFT_666358 [Halenospora varia]
MAELMHSRETSPCPTFRRISVDMLLNGLPSSHGLLSSAQKAISTASLDELTLCQPFSPKEDSSPSLCLIDFDRIDEAVPLNTSVSSPLTPHIRSSAPSPASLYIQSNTRMAEVLGGHHSSPVSDLYLGSPKISTLPLPMRILSLHERFVNRLKEQEEIVEGVDGPLRPARNCLDTSHGPDANRGTITSLKPPRMPPRIDNPNEVESTCADRNFAVSGTTREGTLKDSRRVQNKPLPKTHVQGDLTSVLGSHPYHPQRPQAHQFFDSFSPQGSDSRGNKRPLPQERLGGSPHTANLPETIKRTFLRNAFHKSEKYLVIALSHIATLATAAGREKEDDCFPPFKQKRKKPHHYWQAHLREWASLLGRHAIDHINEVLEADGCSQCGLSYSNTKTISIYIWWRICKLVSDIEKVPTPPTNEDLVVEGEFQQGLCLLSELWDGLETALWEDLRNSYRVYCFDPTIQCDPKSKSLPDLLKEGLFQEVPDLRALPDVVAYTRTNPEVHTTQTESTIEAILVRIQNRARNISVSLQLFFKDAPVARSDFEQLVYIFRSTSTDCQASPDISKPLVETERTTRPSFRTWINRVRRELKTSPISKEK